MSGAEDGWLFFADFLAAVVSVNQLHKAGVEPLSQLSIGDAERFYGENDAGRCAQIDLAGAEVERTKLAMLLGKDRGGEFADRRNHAGDELWVVLAFAVRPPMREQTSAAALQQKDSLVARRARLGERDFGNGSPGRDRFQPQPPLVGRDQSVQPLVDGVEKLVEGVGDSRGDESARDRVKRLDHHVARIVDFGADRGDDDGRNSRGEFAVASHFRAPHRFNKNFGRRRLKPLGVANPVLEALDMRLRFREARRLRAEKQGLEPLEFVRFAAGRGHATPSSLFGLPRAAHVADAGPELRNRGANLVNHMRLRGVGVLLHFGDARFNLGKARHHGRSQGLNPVLEGLEILFGRTFGLAEQQLADLIDRRRMIRSVGGFGRGHDVLGSRMSVCV